jgi:hypothetical protein
MCSFVTIACEQEKSRTEMVSRMHRAEGRDVIYLGRKRYYITNPFIRDLSQLGPVIFATPGMTIRNTQILPFRVR